MKFFTRGLDDTVTHTQLPGNSPLINTTSCGAATMGLVKVMGLPDGALLSMGLMGRYMITIPSENLVVVAFGATLARLACHVKGGGGWSSEEGIILSQIWAALGNATRPALPAVPASEEEGVAVGVEGVHVVAAGEAAGEAAGIVAGGGVVGRRVAAISAAETEEARTMNASSHAGTTPPSTLPKMWAAHTFAPTSIPAMIPAPAFASAPNLTTTTPPIAATTATTATTATAASLGSCYCYCGYEQSIGRCFNGTATAAACTAHTKSADTAATIGAFCPRSSLLFDCWEDANEGKPCPPSMYTGSELDKARPPTACSAKAPPVGPLVSVRQCHYIPTAFTKCFFVPKKACADSPQFPLLAV